ncbi:pilus (MSHA type) biogenesis protein MshL [Alteromonas sp. 5E99-2]|uniref:pilus (MSHA type) biogenesis protein MshL n=1 Tax=Alteromonas sp. 5E99-2 TaxID=2817683 RepID=UPI001A9846A5|nr:pilus (MSHA type) biogenesis protein MshL [Alteromonas sp. 5E99-2]MBO1255849.1 pilus (MSHA type) biogenesis protein MshL [Alteromonas sp. 5E99-2]
MNVKNARIGLVILGIVLVGCKSTLKPDEFTKELDSQIAEQKAMEASRISPKQDEGLPAAINDFLSPETTNTEQTSSLFGVQKYDVEAESVEIRAFFKGLVADTPYSIAVHPEVEGVVSLSLKQVPLPDIISLVGDLYSLDVQRKDTVFRISPSTMRTETFAVNYLLIERDGNTQTSIISGGVSQADGNNNNNGSNSLNGFSGNSASNSSSSGNQNTGINGVAITTRTETNFWENLQTSLQSMIGNEDGRVVFVSPQAGLVTVRALPEEIRAIKSFLQASETNLQRQVILEARILEVTLSDNYQQGINWNEVVGNVGSTDFQFNNTAATIGNDLTAILGGVTSLSFVNQDFSGVLSLLSTQGNVQVLSSPRVTATNNQKAVIKVGEDEYFVTDVSSQSTVTSTSTTVVPDVELTPFFSGIALDVTPQIDENGSVLLHVHPSVIETDEQEKVVTLDGEQLILPLALSTIRESDTVIKALSGEIVVIGGLMQTTISDSTSKTPVLGDIPYVGELFTNKSQIEIKKELIILLKPTIVGEGTWSKQLESTREKMADWLFID